MNFSVLGCGRWGSFIAWYLDHYHNNVTMWGREQDPFIHRFMETRANEYVTLPESINLTTDLEAALDFSEYIIISISAQAVRSFLGNLSKVKGFKDKKYILCMKGVEDGTGKRLSEILIEFGIDKNNIAVWVGPGHIQAFTKGIPSCMVIDSYNKDLSLFWSRLSDPT